jgi:hypothetical protein
VSRDEFPKSVVEALAKRAAYICSNPDCRASTIAPSPDDESKFIYIGKAAHVTAASSGGPRFDETMSPEERSAIGNGIFLCSNCADMIDKIEGRDYPVASLLRWKDEHESWASQNLNKRAAERPVAPTVINVASHDQRGGITAGILNVGAQPRDLTPKLMRQLLEALPDKEGDVTVTCILGDGEAFRFATSIKDYLVGQGYTVNGVNQAVFSGPLEGQTIDPEKRTIRIGTRQ